MVHIVPIRRAALALLVFCFAWSLAADAYHPHILKSQVVSLDGGAIERFANSKTPFDLALGDTHFTLILAPAPVWPAEGLTLFEIAEDGSVTKRLVQGNVTYAGDVVGEDPAASEARFLIARGVLEGYVLSSTGWWFVEPLVKFDPKASSDQYLVYATRDLDFAIEYGDDAVPGDDPADPVADEVIVDRRIRITMVADLPYILASAPNFQFYERQAALLNRINGIYGAQLGKEFRFENSIYDLGGMQLTSRNPGLLLEQLDTVIRINGGLQSLNSKLVHLTTARDMEGQVMGAAVWGVRSFSQQVFIHVSGGGGSNHSLAYQGTMHASHEIGHNFTAEHIYADKWCVTDVVICWDYERTIMWATFYPDNNARFSDGTRDPDHNNEQRIRDNMRLRRLW